MKGASESKPAKRQARQGFSKKQGANEDWNIRECQPGREEKERY